MVGTPPALVAQPVLGLCRHHQGCAAAVMLAEQLGRPD
jgi:hypothetical protein